MLFRVHADDEHTELRRDLLQFRQDVEPAFDRHRNVEYDDIYLLCAHEGKGFLPAVGLPHNFDVRLILQQPFEAIAHQTMIVSNEDFNHDFATLSYLCYRHAGHHRRALPWRAADRNVPTQ